MGFTSKVCFSVDPEGTGKCIRPILINSSFNNILNIQIVIFDVTVNASKSYRLIKSEEQFNEIACIHS